MMEKEEALKLAESKWWEGKSDVEVAEFQLKEKLLCCPFNIFQEAVEKALGRPVWTHEFAFPGELLAELHGENKPRTLTDVIKKAEDLVGRDRIIIVKEVNNGRTSL